MLRINPIYGEAPKNICAIDGIYSESNLPLEIGVGRRLRWYRAGMVRLTHWMFKRYVRRYQYTHLEKAFSEIMWGRLGLK